MTDVTAAVPVMTGTLINVFLHGVLTVQIYDYFMHFPKDKLPLKLLVNGLFIVENFQTALTLYDAYRTLATGTSSTVHNLELVGAGSGIVAAIVAFTTHSFYAHRIRVLSRVWWLACIIVLSSFIQLVFGIAVGVIVLQAKTAAGLLEWSTFGITLTWFAVTAWCDIIIAIAMVVLLSGSNTGFSTPTRRVVKRAIRLTVETGVITAGVAVICFLLIAIFPRHIYFSALSISVPKWYSNTLLAQLNSRAEHCGEAGDSDESDHVHEIQFAYSLSQNTGRSAPQITSIRRTSTVPNNPA